MSLPTDNRILLTVRGQYRPSSPEAARTLHNETAGSAEGMAAARSFGDLSHKVYLPATGAGDMGGTRANELLFIDVWKDPQGLMQFFSNPEVDQQGGKMFTAKDPTVWMAARSAYTFNMPAPTGQTAKYVGLIRTVIASPEKAIEIFANTISANIADARRLGQLSHEIFIRLPAPGQQAPAELLGVDVWSNLSGMGEHYKKIMGGLAPAFVDKPQTSLWQQAEGGWSEW